MTLETEALDRMASNPHSMTLTGCVIEPFRTLASDSYKLYIQLAQILVMQQSGLIYIIKWVGKVIVSC